MRTLTRIIALLIILTGTGNHISCSQPVQSEKKLFGINNPLPITITYDFKELDRDMKEDAYIPGKISYYQQDSSLIEKSIRIRPRGNSRRDQCMHPPLRIDFSDSLYGISLFNHWGKMKLVSVCVDANNYEQYIIKEYLIYKAYEILTDISFKTYQVTITFSDSGGGKKSYESPGFFIEDIDDLAKSLNAVPVEPLGMQPSMLDSVSFDLMALFQFMIGNTDWYVQNLHNIRLIRIKDIKKPRVLPVPYDFDYSGLVNASYAVPHENLPIKSVRDRYFMGICRTQAEFVPLVKLFREKKGEIYKVFMSCTGLNAYNKKDVINYLNSFYKMLENPKTTRKYIYGNCN